MKYLDCDYYKKISKIGLGCGRVGTIIPNELSFELMDEFYLHGGTLLDTARSYSLWEKMGMARVKRVLEIGWIREG